MNMRLITFVGIVWAFVMFFCYASADTRSRKEFFNCNRTSPAHRPDSELLPEERSPVQDVFNGRFTQFRSSNLTGGYSYIYLDMALIKTIEVEKYFIRIDLSDGQNTWVYFVDNYEGNIRKLQATRNNK